MKAHQPLAYRMAPKSLDQYVGQEEILGEGKVLRRLIEKQAISSMILFGPPGTGKTALARLISYSVSLPFKKLNAVTDKVSDIKAIASEAKNLILTPGGSIILFVDEIHRFNKLQQDALLPYIEDGSIILIGATTENPYFRVNQAILSRCLVFQLKPLSQVDIIRILKQAVQDKEAGLGNLNVEISTEGLLYIARKSNGDARYALNALETSVQIAEEDPEGKINLDLETISKALQNKLNVFDRDGEAHYDTISAFIKSMRGSDPDAAVYYLALALEGGEDIEFLARRILICASEDVGLANPAALQVAMAAFDAVRVLGMPEARIILSEAAILVAISPKSNASYLAINKAIEKVKSIQTPPIPMKLRNAPHEGMKELGYSDGYKYPHDFDGGIIYEDYLPDALEGEVFYNPTDRGYEGRSVQTWLNNFRKNRKQSKKE